MQSLKFAFLLECAVDNVECAINLPSVEQILFISQRSALQLGLRNDFSLFGFI